MCTIEEVTLFLTLASITTSAVDGKFDDLIAISSSCWIQSLKKWSEFLLNK